MDADLLEVLDGVGEPRILVVGDLMLDRFTRGAAGRVSPEAPALILRREGEDVLPGGAARVAALLRALGARVGLAGVVGDDPEGRLLRGLLEGAGVECEGVLAAADRPTTLKQRFCGLGPGGGLTQLLRVDSESREPLPPAAARRLLGRVGPLLTECDAVLVCDHDKGVCGPGLLAGVLATPGRPVLVDPAPGVRPDRYKGAEALLPNRAEAGAALGRDIGGVEDALAAAGRLLADSGAGAVLLKLDRDGMALARRGERVALYPARARGVCDVAGAGDVVLATAGLCRAARLGWERAAALASAAAGLAVERPCAQLVSREELRLRLSRPDFSTADKLVTLEGMEALMGRYRERGFKVALANGCFDLLHAGHAAHLEEAAGAADVLVVAVNSDASVRRLKGADRPVVGQADRAAVVAAPQCVDHVLLFGEDTPHELLRRLRPDVLAKGGDYGPDEVAGGEVVRAYGGRVCVTQRRPGPSTTQLMGEVLRRHLAVVAQD